MKIHQNIQKSQFHTLKKKSIETYCNSNRSCDVLLCATIRFPEIYVVFELCAEINEKLKKNWRNGKRYSFKTNENSLSEI